MTSQVTISQLALEYMREHPSFVAETPERAICNFAGWIDAGGTAIKKICWACHAEYTGPSNPSGKCPNCPDNDRPETPYELEMMAKGQSASDPYDVTCARCGKTGTSATFMVEEGNEWECPECWERCEAEERYNATHPPGSACGPACGYCGGCN